MVKSKSVVLRFFSAPAWRQPGWILPAVSLLSFIFSWAAVYPSDLVEYRFARGIFPKISYIIGKFADSVPFSWLDVAILAAGVLLVILGRKRRWGVLLNLTAGFYLFFFWTWGLNYHRKPLNSKLQLESARMEPQPMTKFAEHAAAELNRLYRLSNEKRYDELGTRSEAVQRVRRVVAIVDNSDWESAHRIKVSWVGNPWLRSAGVDGVFNPIGHEPVISSTLLDIERPFVMSHELAHVRGYPDEGDANVIATFATLMSGNPAFQYSGWLSLWLYLRTPELEKLLDPGPRHDIQRIFERGRKEQIRWVSDFQQVLLDWFLKANSIDEGVRSYSRVVLVASGTEPFWDRFR